MNIKTSTQASELPELTHEIYDSYAGQLRPFSGIGIDGDDIIAFIDRDGISKHVVSFYGTIYKSEFLSL